MYANINKHRKCHACVIMGFATPDEMHSERPLTASGSNESVPFQSDSSNSRLNPVVKLSIAIFVLCCNHANYDTRPSTVSRLLLEHLHGSSSTWHGGHSYGNTMTALHHPI